MHRQVDLVCLIPYLLRTCKIWDVRTGECITTLLGAYDEVLDINFNSTGTKIVTASADGNARIYNVYTGACIAKLTGHDGEISRCHFNPQGTKIITAGVDCTCRVWSVETGEQLQVLKGKEIACFWRVVIPRRAYG